METQYSITGDQLECIVCTEIPVKVLETDCCGTIVCQDCGPKLDKCPNRCVSETTKLALNVNKFVQRMINHIKVKCEHCDIEFPRSQIIEHKEDCDKNLLKAVLFNPALHPCFLHKMSKSNSWFCDGLKIIKHGCASSGTEKKVTTNGESWYCSRCDVDFCEKCILAYGGNSDENDLKAYPKEGLMHLTHPHPMKMYFGVNLPEAARLNCYGKYKSTACNGEGSDKIRYLVCFDCKLVLCEKCYVSPFEDYITTNKKIHKHKTHLQAIPITFSWGCDIKGKNCIKASHDANKACKISQRCDLCDFDVCAECLK